MSLQTVYSENIPVGYVGQPAGPDFEADSRIVETAAGIGFGLACGRGTGERGAVLGGAQFAGISMRDITQDGGLAGTVDEYPQYGNIALMTKGLIWVAAGAVVEAGDLVHYNETTGALSNAGGTLIANATWESSAAEGDLAKVRLSGTLAGIAAGT